MLLALSIVSEQGGDLGAAAYKVFDERGGSIGRIAGNDWVLPDVQNFVSSRHARVSAVSGAFYLEDTSSNGTFINAPDRAVPREQPQALNDGDRLYIGDYEIVVQIIGDEPAVVVHEAAAPSEVMVHQAAMRAAVRDAFRSMLAKLSPERLVEIDPDREAHFEILFGDDFAVAYSQHLQKLRAEAGSR
jgi:predicted component of type VI protein secretion system